MVCPIIIQDGTYGFAIGLVLEHAIGEGSEGAVPQPRLEEAEGDGSPLESGDGGHMVDLLLRRHILRPPHPPIAIIQIKLLIPHLIGSKKTPDSFSTQLRISIAETLNKLLPLPLRQL